MENHTPASYIHMVHYLIENCILLKMTKEECMDSLSKNANISTIITATVWKELKKENEEFFEAYENGGLQDQDHSPKKTMQ